MANIRVKPLSLTGKHQSKTSEFDGQTSEIEDTVIYGDLIIKGNLKIAGNLVVTGTLDTSGSITVYDK